MSKYFDNSEEWSEEKIFNVGLPRPFAKVPKIFLNTPSIKKMRLAKKFPVPWQSFPKFHGNTLGIVFENEDRIYIDSLCPYCGIRFNNEEICIRWTATDSIPSREGPRIFSDSYPFHIECMKQARIFCPHMRETKDEEFEIGSFIFLKAKADSYTKPFKKNTPKE